jgi:hypothetical protein
MVQPALLDYFPVFWVIACGSYAVGIYLSSIQLCTKIWTGAAGVTVALVVLCIGIWEILSLWKKFMDYPKISEFMGDIPK